MIRTPQTLWVAERSIHQSSTTTTCSTSKYRPSSLHKDVFSLLALGRRTGLLWNFIRNAARFEPDAGFRVWMIRLRLIARARANMSAQINKKPKFVADGAFRAELNVFFTRELSEEGYPGCDVRVTHAHREEVRTLRHLYIISFAPHTHTHTHKKSLERRVAVSESLLLLFRSDSNFPRILLSFMPRRCRLVAFPLSRNVRVCGTSY